MKNCLIRFAVLTSLAASPFATPALADVPVVPMSGIMQPPAENPHPPQSAEDKRRVAFAEQVIQAQLRNIAPLNGGPAVLNLVFQDKDLACLQAPACYGKDLAYIQELKRLQDTYGQALEVRHAHIVPWSLQKFLQQHRAANASPGTGKIVSTPMTVATPQIKDDEYIIHAYVRFSKTGHWNHLSIIVTEDPAGKLAFRHFFTTPMDGIGPPPC